MLRRLALAACLLCAAPAAGPALGASEFVGPESCNACHKEAYRVWSASAHARAAQSLDPEQRKQALCLQCHSRDEQRSGAAQVAGVSCETCHGGGKSYQPAVVMRDKELARLVGLLDPTPATCLTCHNADSPSLKAFDVKEAMSRIDHWTAERKGREGKSAKASPDAKASPHGKAPAPAAAQPAKAATPAQTAPAKTAPPQRSPLAAWLRSAP
jgi:hypothetical protein